ncbi:hypothetical protein OUZ56_023753 [Daphnia magna]|uniref:GMP synthase n=1 Tax=Daphnia magna TaxID=35525 RepID=A0ABR0AZK7_9CRUS|nr:hypothetical protein OUZ56_023753 [Daphnia magna]
MKEPTIGGTKIGENFMEIRIPDTEILSRVKREIGYLFAQMSHPLLGQRYDGGEEIIGRSPL